MGTTLNVFIWISLMTSEVKHVLSMGPCLSSASNSVECQNKNLLLWTNFKLLQIVGPVTLPRKSVHIDACYLHSLGPSPFLCCQNWDLLWNDCNGPLLLKTPFEFTPDTGYPQCSKYLGLYLSISSDCPSHIFFFSPFPLFSFPSMWIWAYFLPFICQFEWIKFCNHLSIGIPEIVLSILGMGWLQPLNFWNAAPLSVQWLGTIFRGQSGWETMITGQSLMALKMVFPLASIPHQDRSASWDVPHSHVQGQCQWHLSHFVIQSSWVSFLDLNSVPETQIHFFFWPYGNFSVMYLAQLDSCLQSLSVTRG